jgi:hypothetical protein
LTEFRYGDAVLWKREGSASEALATVIDERRWGVVSAGPPLAFPAEISDYPVFIRVAYEPEPRWVHGSELRLVQQREGA